MQVQEEGAHESSGKLRSSGGLEEVAVGGHIGAWGGIRGHREPWRERGIYSSVGQHGSEDVWGVVGVLISRVIEGLIQIPKFDRVGG